MIHFDISPNCIIANTMYDMMQKQKGLLTSWYDEQNVTENSSLLAMCVVDMKYGCLGVICCCC